MIPKDELWKILKLMKECIKITTISKITRIEIITTIQAIQGKDLYIDLEVQADCRVQKKGGFMKKFLVLLSALMLFVSVPMAEAKKPTPDDVASIGFKILESNDIQKRMVFKHTIFIKNPRATLDYKPENVGLDSTGRVLWVYGDVLNLTDNEDELAGLLSHAIDNSLLARNPLARVKLLKEE